LWLSPPLKRTWPFICTIMNSLSWRMICAKFKWNWPAGSGEIFFQKFSVNGYCFAIFAFRWYNFKSTSPKDDLCQRCLKLVLWFWRKSQKSKSLTDRWRTTGDQKSSFELSVKLSAPLS
jgi:hypothetical protein